MPQNPAQFMRRQRIRSVLLRAAPHLPKDILEDIDKLLVDLYEQIKTFAAQEGGIPAGARRIDLENITARMIPIEELEVGESMLIESKRIAGVRQKIFRLRCNLTSYHHLMRFETKKLKGGHHRITRVA